MKREFTLWVAALTLFGCNKTKDRSELFEAATARKGEAAVAEVVDAYIQSMAGTMAGQVEMKIRESGVPFTVVRPACVRRQSAARRPQRTYSSLRLTPRLSLQIEALKETSMPRTKRS